MKTKFVITILMAVICSSCSMSSPDYLPDSENIDVNVYGSYISIVMKDAEHTTGGELIAVDSANFIVLTETDDSLVKKIKIVPVKKVDNFVIKYAEGDDYIAAVPLYTLASLTHGYYALITLPLNLIITLVVNSEAFVYSDKNISLDDLKMFARFPQGIPPNIRYDSIK
ncbi:MAG: hypothetical protein IPL53_15975 [Ignavibacteria bacterium]|nr:hypothetical protein [Ignavibacteria bacterium]